MKEEKPKKATHKFDINKLERLERPERYAIYKPEELLVQAGLTAGMSCVDIGCGTGFYTGIALNIVGKTGEVFALDIEDRMLDYTQHRNLDGNLHLLKSQESTFPLLDKKLDFAIMGLVLHEAIDPVSFLQETARVLKDGGILVGLEWKKKQEDKGPAVHERIDSEETRKLLEVAGFRDIQLDEWTDSHYVFKAIITKK